MTPIEAAVAPLKADAIARAEKLAREEVARIIDDLAAHGWNIRKAAPYPDSFRCSRVQYARAKSKYNIYSMVTTTAEQYAYGEKAHIVKMDKVKVERYVEQTKENAATSYDMFVRKLNHKVGDHRAATLEGNHVWGRSILYVVMPDKSIQKWKTLCIDNRSKLGLWFNQWPSRKVK